MVISDPFLAESGSGAKGKHRIENENEKFLRLEERPLNEAPVDVHVSHQEQSPEGEDSVWFTPFLDGSRPWRNPDMLPAQEDRSAQSFSVFRPRFFTAGLGSKVTISDRDELDQAMARDRKVRWVGVPELSFLIPAELLHPSVSRVDLAAFRRMLRSEIMRPLRLLALHVALFLFLKNPFFLILALIFGFFPFLDLVLDLRRRPDLMSVEELNRERVDESLFFLWMKRVGRGWIALAVTLLGGIYLIQEITGLERSLEIAALIKSRVWAGEWWRLITVGFLHGHPLHLFFNCFALFYLARVIATLAPIRLLLPLFLISLLGGSIASLLLMPHIDSVGASGGIMGLLGFLTIHGFRFRGFLPHGVGSGILRSVGSMILIGILGAAFIDNAAHAGGFFGGTVFALVFYRRRKPENTRLSPLGNITCRLSGLVIAGCIVFVAAALLGISSLEK